VVGEDAEGEHSDPAETLVLAEKANELFALRGTEDEVAVHDPRHAVVVGDGKRRGGLQATLTHERRIKSCQRGPPSPDLRIVALSRLVA